MHNHNVHKALYSNCEIDDSCSGPRTGQILPYSENELNLTTLSSLSQYLLENLNVLL